MTLSEARQEFERLKALDKPYFVPADVAKILGCESYAINLRARDNPDGLGFPIIKSGCRVKIPRAAFLDFIGRNVLGDAAS